MFQTARIASGIPGFDALLDGGLPRGNVIILAGHPGVGKTTFCIQFLCYGSLRLGERSLYVTFSETKPKLVRNMAQFGFDLKEIEQRSLLRMEFIQLSTQSNSVSAAIDQIARAIEEFRPSRVVIDSASSLALAVQGGRSDVLFMLQNLFAKLGAYEDVTSILVAEMSSGTDQFGNGVEEFISDGIAVIRLRTRGKTKVKSIEVRKMRGTSHSTKSVLLEINENGVEVDPEIELTS